MSINNIPGGIGTGPCS